MPYLNWLGWPKPIQRQYMLHAVLLFATLVITTGKLAAQVNPPEFLCVKNDTLLWELPVNNCGAFNAYLIYNSENREGPYNLLATVTDPGQNSFYHDGAGNQTWHYYLESDVDCPGEPVLQSDTLNNRIPDPGPIRLVTVEDETTVRVEWSASPSPEVVGYIVSRQNALGTTILDTVFNTLTYTDGTATPGERPETFFVVALDPCGNVSLVPDPHQTIFLQIASVDSCSQEVQLLWSPYINWPNGVDRYEVLVSETPAGGGTASPFTIAGAVEGNTTMFTFPASNSGSTFCFKVQAVAEGSGDQSLSNEVCVEVGAVQAVRDLVIANLQVAPESVTVNWILEPAVTLSSATLFRAENGTDFSPIQDLNAGDQRYVDMTSLANSRSLTYRIEAVDQCGNEIITNAVSTIYLSGSIGDGSENVLNWTPYNNEAGRLLTYLVYRQVGNSESLDDMYTDGQLRHIDPVDLTDPEQAVLCYYVLTEEEVILSDRTVTVQSSSNRVCLEQSAKLFVPNAFVPDGVNREFKPVLQFGGSEEYLMTIYDRYGGVIFESRDLATGWDGRKNGRPLPQGVYLYMIKMRQSGGQEIEKKGTVMLLR